MFESLNQSLQKIFSKLSKYGKLTPKLVDSSLRDVRRALLQADVNFKVSKDFIEQVRERAVGKEVLESLTPVQSLIKIVRDELIQILGETEWEPDFKQIEKPVKILLTGLQGSGKTTTAAKYVNYLKNNLGMEKVAVVACDVERPAAIEQLVQLGAENNFEVIRKETKEPLDVARKAIKNQQNYQALVFDSQGRLHVDEKMMESLSELSDLINPDLTFLVVDSMMGQESLNVADTFDRKLNIDSVILTKLDGDARGGAALSVVQVTGKKIAYAGTGEKIDDFDLFHPDRMASRILGMGDMLSLIEKAEKEIDKKKAIETQKKLMKGKFNLNDFLEQLKEIKKLGSMSEIMDFLPKNITGNIPANMDNESIKKTEAIILSMTFEEREKPSIIGASRKDRIAKGSGVSIQDINRLLKSYHEMRKMFKSFKKSPGRKFPINFPFGR